MWSKTVRIVIFLVFTAAVVAEGMPSYDKQTNQNQVLAADVPKAIQTNSNDAKGNTAGKSPNERHSPKAYKKMRTAMVDDDLLEFLVRVADSPAEWNKIQRVLNMLGREEMATPAGSDTIASTSPTIITTTVMVPLTLTQTPLPTLQPSLPIRQNTSFPPPQQLNTSVSPPQSQQMTTSVSSAPPPQQQPKTSVLPSPWKQWMTTVAEPPRQPETMVPTPPQKITVPALQLQQLKTTQQTGTSSSWPSGDWILEVVEKIRAAAKARRKGSGSAAEDAYDYDEDDGGDDEDDYGSDEIEEIEEPEPTDASIVPATAHPPPPQPPRAAAGHMSRYQFKRIDGSPDDGRVNGTYVAVVESDRPSRDAIYDPVKQTKLNVAVN